MVSLEGKSGDILREIEPGSDIKYTIPLEMPTHNPGSNLCTHPLSSIVLARILSMPSTLGAQELRNIII